MKQRLLAMLLVVCVVMSMVPCTAFAAGTGETIISAHECGGERVIVSSLDELQTAIDDETVSDIVLSSESETVTWQWNEPLEINRDVHIVVEQGKTITFRRANADAELFRITADGSLTLGDGVLTYTGDDAQTAYEAGTYAIQSVGGQLVIDGGARWVKGADFVSGETASGQNMIVFYDGNVPYIHTKGDGHINSSTSLITNAGTLNMWGGVTLQNNDKATVKFGGAICSDPNSTLNVYGGTITKCAASVCGDDRGVGGGIYMGNTGVDWEVDDKGAADTTVFRMYGGNIYNNIAYDGWGVADGGGVAIDQTTMELYGGEIAYNHGGLDYHGDAGDGGGIIVRCGSTLNMYGGVIHHNYTGGYGGGVVAWNGTINIRGGEIKSNTAAYGGGVGISASYNSSGVNFPTANVNMSGGSIAYNEARVTSKGQTGGFGGGICAGSGRYKKGAHLNLSGGEIFQNKAVNGGGLAVYAEKNDGWGEGASNEKGNTEVTLSGNFDMRNNAAYENGGGMYIENTIASNTHSLVVMSGNACVDTNNTIYFENVCNNQIPVQVIGRLTRNGTVGIFEFSSNFWDGASGDYAHATANQQIVQFADGLDIQENKFALDSDLWYLKAGSTVDASVRSLTLQQYDHTKQYWIRNGTPVTVDGHRYYRIYDNLSDAFTEAASNDTLYVFYNATMKSTATVDGKHLTLLAESTSSAAQAAARASGSGYGMTEQVYDDATYDVMTGPFLRYNDAEDAVGDRYSVSGKTGTLVDDGNYTLNTYEYNVRNDYTVTLASDLDMGADQAAIVVTGAGRLDFGQEAQVGLGYGSLAFDGNYSYPTDGPMLRIMDRESTAVLHSGTTLMKHTNKSTEFPGTVYTQGTFEMMDYSVVSGGVSPIAGAVYVGDGGVFDLNGGSVTDNVGAMPRYENSIVARIRHIVGEDSLYHGQPKYYYGAGAVCSAAGGTMNMLGGTVSKNRGEWGAIANLGGMLNLTGGMVEKNAAIIGTGAGTEYDLAISGYDDDVADLNKATENVGCGGGVYVGDGDANLSGVTITGNWAQQNGGGIAVCGGSVGFSGAANTEITHNRAGQTDAVVETGSMGGGIFANHKVDVTENVVLTDNEAEIGGGLAALGVKADKTIVTISSDVDSNSAKYGGGIYVGAYSEITVQDANLEDSTAVYGGGAYIDCLKNGDVVVPIDPGDADDLGEDVAESYGRLILKNARVNNNHLTEIAGTTSGLGSGVYNRGTLILDKNAYASGNDRLYLEKGHVVTLGDAYDAVGQSVEDRLTISSRETALKTNIIQMANESQFVKLLAKGHELVVHHQNIPMALSLTDGEDNIIELNYYKVTYYDRIVADGDLESHKVEELIIPGNTYTVLGWNAINEKAVQNGDVELVVPDGKSLERWQIAHYDETANTWDIEEDGGFTAGDTYNGVGGDLCLVAKYTTNQFLAVMFNNVAGQEKPTDKNDVSLGKVTLYNDDLTSSQGGLLSYFSMSMDMALNVTPVKENGHQKGVLKSIDMYEFSRTLTAAPMSIGANELTYGTNIYKKAATATFETVTLKNGTETETYVADRPTGWKAVDGRTLDPKQFYCDETGTLHYVGGSKHVLFIVTFDEANVELTMVGMKGSDAVYLTEYYDTLYQAFTRMTNLVNEPVNGEVWTDAVITPLRANANDTVYYYGKDGGTHVNNMLDTAKKINITFDLNGFTLDLQTVSQKILNAYHLTVKNGTVISNVTAGSESTSQFLVKDGGSLTLRNATLCADKATYSVIVESGTDNMLVDKDSHVGKVLLKGEDSDIKVIDPADWTELDGGKFTATIYTDLHTLAVPAVPDEHDVLQDGNTRTDRQVIYFDVRQRAAHGHAVRTHFDLKDVVVDDEYGDESGYWFINTDGHVNPRVHDVVPQLVCLKHSQVEESHQIRKETKATGDKAIQHVDIHDDTSPYYPIYYLYERNYGYNNRVSDGHPLSLRTTIRDVYGNRVTAAGGVVTVTMAVFQDGQKNRVLTAREQVLTSDREVPAGDAMYLHKAGTSVYTGTDANTTFPATDHEYYLTGSFTGAGEYAANYSRYWKVQDTKRADNDAEYMTGLSKLKINKKPLSDESIQVTFVTPNTATFIGSAGANSGNTSRAGSVRVADNNNGLNLTSGDDLQICYRRLTTENRGAANLAGTVGEITYYYADEDYYTATGAWYGSDMIDTVGKTDEEIKAAQNEWARQHVKKIDGQSVGIYSVELAAIKIQSQNYTSVSGWKNKMFEITPYTGRLNTDMSSNHVVISEIETNPDAVKDAIRTVIGAKDQDHGLKVTDIYGNVLANDELTYEFEPADGTAKLDENGWPCAEGLYSIEVRPYDGNESSMSEYVVDGQLEDNPNYSETAVGYQALLITKEELSMEIQVDNSGSGDGWTTGDALEVPYIGSIYREDDVKVYDAHGGENDHLRVVKKSTADDSETVRLENTKYGLQVGLPNAPALNSDVYVMVATDETGKYVAIGEIEIMRNKIAKVDVVPAKTIYTGKKIEPTIVVKDGTGVTLVEDRDYTATFFREVPTVDGETTRAALTATGVILNADKYIIRVTGKGNYGGDSIDTKFVVEPKDISSPLVSQEDNHIPVNVSVPQYNIGTTRPKAFLSYNGMVMSPGADYMQQFREGGVTSDAEGLYPDEIIFTGVGNYKGTRIIPVKTAELPQDADLHITDSNNAYIYQADDLFGYISFSDLDIQSVSREENRWEPGIEDYKWEIASIKNYLDNDSDPERTAFVSADGVILDAGTYIVKVTEGESLAEPSDAKTGYFFVRISQRPVTITVDDQWEYYGESVITYPYNTDLFTTVGSARPLAELESGKYDVETKFFSHDHDSVKGSLSRAEGENVGSYYYSLNTFTAGANYMLTVSPESMFLIMRKSLCETDGDGGTPNVTVPGSNIIADVEKQVEYTGYPVSPLNSITYQTELSSLGLQTLAEGKDYTLTYYRVEGDVRHEEQLAAAPIDVGNYVLKITGIGNYMNALEYEFSVVTAGKMLKAQIKGETSVTYKAAAYHPAVDIKTTSGSTLTANNYKLSYYYTGRNGKASTPVVFQSGITSFTEAGTYTITANGIGNYSGAFGETVFVIKPKNLASIDEADGTSIVKVENVKPQQYSGKSITFDDGLDSVTYSGLKTGGLEGDDVANLKYGVDYHMAYMNNVNAGTADVVLIGAGNYTGSRDMKFVIRPKMIYVTVDAAEKIYGEIDPDYAYRVYEDEAGTKELTDVRLIGKPGRTAGENAGAYDLTVDGNGNTLTADRNYVITLIGSPKLTIHKKTIGFEDGNAAELISVNQLTYLSSEETFDGARDRISVTYWAAKLGQQDVPCDVTIKDANDVEVDYTKMPTEKAIYTVTVTPTSSNYDGILKMTATAIDADYLLQFEADDKTFVYTNDPAKPNQFIFTPKDKNDTIIVPDSIECSVSARNGKQVTMGAPKKNDDGSYTYDLSEAGTYIITATKTAVNGTVYQGSTIVTVSPKDVNDVQIAKDVEGSVRDYTGNAVELGDSLLVYNKIAVAETDEDVRNYAVSYRDNVLPHSEASATVVGMGNYTGTRHVDFKIGSMQYTLYYDTNGGNSAGPEVQKSQTTFTVATGDKVTHATEHIDGKDVGVLFIGWSVLSNSGKIYANGDNLPEAENMFYAGQTLTPDHPVTTLYAIWGYDTDGNHVPDVVQDTIKVVYDKGGDHTNGVPPVDSQKYLVGQTAIAKDNGSLTRDGYVFMGWALTGGDHAVDNLETYLKLAGSGVYAASSTFFVGTSGGSVFKMYPVWGVDANGNANADFFEENSVQLIYNANGGTGEPDVQSVQAGETVKLSKIEPVRSGAYFLGWTDNRVSDLLTEMPNETMVIHQSGADITISDDTIGTKTVYALWAEDVNRNHVPDYLETHYSVVYDSNDGNGTVPTDNNMYLAGQTVRLASGSELAKPGYVFAGWSLVPNGEALGVSYEISADLEEETLTFYAVWVEEVAKPTVKAVYHVSDEETEDSESVECGDSIVLKEALVRENYTFLGWTPSENGKAIETVEDIPDGLGHIYQDGESLVLNDNIDLYPVWIKTELLSSCHLVLYRMNGGSDADILNTAFLEVYDSEHIVIAEKPSFDGYEFAGWSDGTNMYRGGETYIVKNDVMFVAQWNKLSTYTVVYEKGIAGEAVIDGDAPTDDAEYVEGKEVLVRNCRLTAEGYDFAGWSNGETTYQPGDKFEITGDTTLTAVWTKKQWTVTVNAGKGGSIVTEDSKTIANGGSFAFKVTVDDDYQIDAVTVNGETVTLDDDGNYVITDIRADQTVIATFSKKSSGGGTGGGGGGDTPVEPEPTPKPVTPDDTGVSEILNTRDHYPFMMGYPNGNFGPNKSVTRAEVAQMFYNLLLNKNVDIKVKFDDVSETAWYSKAVHTLASIGVISGVGKNRYEPERAITRAEFCAIATRFAKKIVALDAGFDDVPKSHWACQYINAAAMFGWIDGYGNNKFGPNDLITRAQAATIVNRMLGRLCDRTSIDAGKGRTFPDVTKVHWAWYHIGEATTKHDFIIGEDYASELWRNPEK